MKNQNIVLICPGVFALMGGCSHFKMPVKRSNVCTAVYSDGAEESADIGPEHAARIRSYHAYQNGGAYAPDVNLFALLGEIQAKSRELAAR